MKYDTTTDILIYLQAVWKGPISKQHWSGFYDKNIPGSCVHFKGMNGISIEEVKSTCESIIGCNLILQKPGPRYNLMKCQCPIPEPTKTPNNDRFVHYMVC